MNTEIMHKTLLEGQENQQQFFVQIEQLLNTKIYIDGIDIDGKKYQFGSLRSYIDDESGLNMSVPVIAALLLPKPGLRDMFFAILADETSKEAKMNGDSIEKLYRKYKSLKDERSAHRDMLKNPDIHKAALAGIALTSAQKRKMRQDNKPPKDPMFVIRYKAGDIKAGLHALVNKHTADERSALPQLVKELHLD